MASLTPVHFADGFDGPDTVALGLEAPELSAAVTGGLLASAIAHSAAPVGLRMPCAALVALIAAALAWGRPQGRSLLRWAGLALRFAAAPRRGGGWVAAVKGGDDGTEPGHGDSLGEPEPAWARWLREAAPGGRRPDAAPTDPAEVCAGDAPPPEPGHARHASGGGSDRAESVQGAGAAAPSPPSVTGAAVGGRRGARPVSQSAPA